MMPDPTFRDTLPETCDFLVAGAGPAGLAAAHRLLSKGAKSVVLLDRRDPWREPVACAEGVMRASLAEASPLSIEPWVRHEIHACRFATERTHFDWRNQGHGAIIDRARMHRDLALDVARLGGICHFRCRAVELTGLQDGWRTLRYDGETSGTLRARCVIDATGPGTGFAKGEPVAQGDHDLEPAAFTHAEGLEYDPEAIQIWLSREFAPGGYAWLFPAGPGRANVGVVCARGTEVSPREGLKRFLAHLQPGVTGQAVFGGAIPCASIKRRPFASNLLFKVGDAASMVHPLGRSGITEALRSGRCAADQALLSIGEPSEKVRRKHYAAYSKRYRKTWGREHFWVALAKPWIARLDDRVWDSLFSQLGQASDGHYTWKQIFRMSTSVLPMAIRTLRPAPRRA